MSTDDTAAAASAPGVDPEVYRRALGGHPAGVVIVTLDPGTGPVGFTATSMASISMRPPLVSFNIAHTSSSFAAVHAADSVVIHLLGEHQQSLARRFSGPAAERFADPSCWSRLPTGEPMLHDTPTWLRTTIEQLVQVGDHTLVIARVHEVGAGRTNVAAEDAATGGDVTGEPVRPLLYHRGRYHRPEPLD
ncbi:flavin reductase family protein [Speluncibacter jeojiensis]|uniref:Flavin reductase family protein n=1 Tax=Speluncibacter jeojiensis TaxID=2710754 RepID=A0A9X4M4Y7_9ACTN|nr:flavin reductase family protein [Rhodococcus sp. D2-41]MDG3016892.1 flavin reductase family protein [Corynebacteriales bacterium D3-21]